MPSNEQAVERAIQDAGKTSARVTPATIDSVIAAEYFTTLDKAFEGCPTVPSLATFTLCVLVLRNGYVVTGESACASAANFDEAIGRRIALENARQKIWPLEGYLLREQLSAAADEAHGQDDAVQAA